MHWIRKFFNWGVVQPAERLTVNQEVAGSSPAAPATDYKGEDMTVANNNRKIKENRSELGSLRRRINELVDELSTLKNELNRFKSDVASDVKYLTERVDG